MSAADRDERVSFQKVRGLRTSDSGVMREAEMSSTSGLFSCSPLTHPYYRPVLYTTEWGKIRCVDEKRTTTGVIHVIMCGFSGKTPEHTLKKCCETDIKSCRQICCLMKMEKEDCNHLPFPDIYKTFHLFVTVWF